MWILDAGFLNLFVEELFEWHTPRLIVVDIGSLKVLQVHEVRKRCWAEVTALPLPVRCE